MRFDAQTIKNVLPSVSIKGTFPSNPQFIIDSRQAKPDTVFIALAGSKADGHDFIVDAIDRGAVAIICSQEKKLFVERLPIQKKDICFVFVPDTLQALFELAQYWRAQFSIPVIGITGSIGKTSTKELCARIVKNAGKNVFVSQGNQNTRIGISLNILQLRPEHELAIFEAGVSERGEMAQLAQLIRPTMGIITCIGHAHMQGLGSLHDIALEKRDLFKYFTEQNIGIIKGDQAQLAVSYSHPVVKFGFKTVNQVQARKVKIKQGKIEFLLKLYKQKATITLNHSHVGMVNNILAASTAAYLLDISTDVIIETISQPCVVPGRFQALPLAHTTGTVIHDSYNANPESMKAALLAFEKIQTNGTKIAVLGEMLELGQNAPFWHRQIGRFLRKAPSIKKIILVGPLMQWTKKVTMGNIKVHWVSSWQDASKLLKESLNQESSVLIKGSNSTGLYNLVSEFARQN